MVRREVPLYFGYGSNLHAGDLAASCSRLKSPVPRLHAKRPKCFDAFRREIS